MLSVLTHLLALWMLPLAASQVVQNPHVQLELVSSVKTVKPGQAFDVGIRFQHEFKWHTYWQNPGDSGLPTRLEWKTPPGFEVGEVEWPLPKRFKLGDLVNFGYKDEVILPVRVAAGSGAQAGPLEVKVKYLICREECIPGEASLSMDLVLGEGESHGHWAAKLKATREGLPGAAPVSAGLRMGPKEVVLELPHALAIKDFFPISKGTYYPTLPVFEELEGKTRIRLAVDEALPPKGKQFEGVVIPKDGAAFRVVASLPGAGKGKDIDLLAILLSALLGGLILNIMPCVFPVLSIKALSLAQKAHGEQAAVRMSGALYTLGVVSTFLALALILIVVRAGGESLGWGFQLQSPTFLVFLSYLFFAIAMNLLGVFELGTSLMGIGPSKEGSGPMGSFVAGVLAVVVATPCTVPFMGTAVGVALTQPVWVTLLIFLFLGLGMALPYGILVWFPGLVNLMPRPGRWMQVFKEVMAFPLLATVAWLLWVLNSLTGAAGLAAAFAGLVLLSIAVWVYSRFGTKTWAAVLALLLAVAALGVGTSHRTKVSRPSAAVNSGGIQWEAFSPGRVQELREEGRLVFVNFTADWCLTCKMNERLVFANKDFQARMKVLNVAMVRGDWTDGDPVITQTLQQYERAGVPLYLVYRGSVNDPPIVLPEVLSVEGVLKYLE